MEQVWQTVWKNDPCCLGVRRQIPCEHGRVQRCARGNKTTVSLATIKPEAPKGENMSTVKERVGCINRSVHDKVFCIWDGYTRTQEHEKT